MLCIALSSYSLSPWQAGTQTARLGPEWEGSLPKVRDTDLANCRRRTWESRGHWSLSTWHTAGKMQELASALTGAWALLVLSTFSQAKCLLSLLLPPALAHFRNLAKVSDNIIFNLLQAGLGSHVRNSKGDHTWSEHQPHGQWMGDLEYTPLHATPNRVLECLSLGIAFWKMCLARQRADFGRHCHQCDN